MANQTERTEDDEAPWGWCEHSHSERLKSFQESVRSGKLQTARGITIEGMVAGLRIDEIRGAMPLWIPKLPKR